MIQVRWQKDSSVLCLCWHRGQQCFVAAFYSPGVRRSPRLFRSALLEKRPQLELCTALVGPRKGSVELAVEAFGAKATYEQPFFGVVEHLLGPGSEAAVDQFKLCPRLVCSIHVETGTNVIPASALPVRV